MLLTKKQHIGAAILFGIALIAWFVIALMPSEPSMPPEPKKKSWAERRDSIRIADSLRYVAWKEARERQYDSARFAIKQRGEAWKAEREHLWDSIRTADSLWRDSVGWHHKAKREKRDTIIDLNHCDTTDLLLIRGVGLYTAIQIVNYREQLGGYYSPTQLTDEPFAKCHLDTLLGSFTADPADVQAIPVNSCSVERLQRHPYLRFEQAKAIYTLRRRNIKLKSPEDLHALPELSKEDIERITPYLSFK